MDAYREYLAIRGGTRGLTAAEYAQAERVLERLQTSSNQERSGLASEIRPLVAQLREHYGVRVDRTRMIELLEHLRMGGGRTAYLVKIAIESFFGRYENMIPDFDRLPAHARVGLSITREEAEIGKSDLWLLEEKLFEDACALFNLAREFSRSAQAPDASKRDVKTAEALARATVIASFNFLEAYLNGIAADYFVRHPDVDPRTRALLLEEPRYVGLRDKALQYPKIYLGLVHPPLTEDNCPELALVLSKAKTTRDSIVHASPLIDQELGVAKEMQFFLLPMSDVEEIVDSTIALVRKIEETIGRNSILLEWLADRGDDGFFQEEAFA